MALLTDSWEYDMFTVLIGAIILLYFYLKRSYTYWERNGFKTLPGANYLCGHFRKTLLRKEFIGNVVKHLYDSTSEPFVGIYSILTPILLVRDPELIRLIMIKDFAHFSDRGVHCNEDYDPLSGNLFGVTGQRWKYLRSQLTPAFTSGKLKAMFSTIIDCGSSLSNYLNEFTINGKSINVREIAACFTTNVTASVGFGIDIDTIVNADNEFRVCGRHIFNQTPSNIIRSFLFFNAPKIMSWFRMKITPIEVEKFICAIAKQNLEYRENNNVSRKDMFQLLIQLRNTGTVQMDDEWETVLNKQKTLSEDEIAAQTFVFFLAGYETSSTTLSFCLYELAKNPDIQERLHHEIDEILEKHNGQMTYESISEMKYLEACIVGEFIFFTKFPRLRL